MRLAFTDIETLGLNEELHAIFEVALITVDVDPTNFTLGNRVFSQWWFELARDELVKADATALRLTHYYERQAPGHTYVEFDERAEFAIDFATATSNAHLVGACIDFDARRLERFLRLYGSAPAWHYHIIDVEALAAGKLGEKPPWDSKELFEKLGVELDEDIKHTAAGDALTAERVYYKVLYD